MMSNNNNIPDVIKDIVLDYVYKLDPYDKCRSDFSVWGFYHYLKECLDEVVPQIKLKIVCIPQNDRNILLSGLIEIIKLTSSRFIYFPSNNARFYLEKYKYDLEYFVNEIINTDKVDNNTIPGIFQYTWEEKISDVSDYNIIDLHKSFFSFISLHFESEFISFLEGFLVKPSDKSLDINNSESFGINQIVVSNPLSNSMKELMEFLNASKGDFEVFEIKFINESINREIESESDKLDRKLRSLKHFDPATGKYKIGYSEDEIAKEKQVRINNLQNRKNAKISSDRTIDKLINKFSQRFLNKPDNEIIMHCDKCRIDTNENNDLHSLIKNMFYSKILEFYKLKAELSSNAFFQKSNITIQKESAVSSEKGKAQKKKIIRKKDPSDTKLFPKELKHIFVSEEVMNDALKVLAMVDPPILNEDCNCILRGKKGTLDLWIQFLASNKLIHKNYNAKTISILLGAHLSEDFSTSSSWKNTTDKQMEIYQSQIKQKLIEVRKNHNL